jgi:tetratricopeptide (TPR) repeat protein
LRAALKLNPGSAQANLLYGLLCATMGRFDEAVAAGRRALQLDPLSPYVHSYLQLLLLMSGRYEEVEKVGQALLQVQPNFALAYMWNGLSHALRGDFGKAEPLMGRAAELDQIMVVTINLGLMRALNGQKALARAQLAKIHRIGQRRYVCPYEIGSVHAAMGEMDDAYRWMDKGLADRCNCMV